jgi:hypothetical protein
MSEHDASGAGVSENLDELYGIIRKPFLGEPSKGVRGVHLSADGYSALANVLGRAFDQSARGKGKERHSKGEEFTQQVIIEGGRRFGHGALMFQAFKKSEESQRLPKDRAVTELLGAIVYLAAAVIVLEETP